MFIWFPPNFFPLLLPHTKLVRDSEEEFLVEKRRGPCCYTLKLGKLSTFKFIPKNRKRDNKLSAQLIIRNSIFAHPSLLFNLKNTRDAKDHVYSFCLSTLCMWSVLNNMIGISWAGLEVVSKVLLKSVISQRTSFDYKYQFDIALAIKHRISIYGSFQVIVTLSNMN